MASQLPIMPDDWPPTFAVLTVHGNTNYDGLHVIGLNVLRLTLPGLQHHLQNVVNKLFVSRFFPEFLVTNRITIGFDRVIQKL